MTVAPLEPSAPHSGAVGETSSAQPGGVPSLRGILHELLVDKRFSAAFSFSRRSSQKSFANMDPLKHELNANDGTGILRRSGEGVQTQRFFTSR